MNLDEVLDAVFKENDVGYGTEASHVETAIEDTVKALEGVIADLQSLPDRAEKLTRRAILNRDLYQFVESLTVDAEGDTYTVFAEIGIDSGDPEREVDWDVTEWVGAIENEGERLLGGVLADADLDGYLTWEVGDSSTQNERVEWSTASVEVTVEFGLVAL